MEDINQDVIKFKHQFQYDLKQFNILKEQYYDWIQRWEKFSKNMEKYIGEISGIINEFNIQYNNLEKILVKENIKNLYKDKSKGIYMVPRMLNNVLEVNGKMFHGSSLLDIPDLIEFCEVQEKDLLQIQAVANENYNNMCTVRGNRDKLSEDYFKFINMYLLNIIDGIKAGIDYTDLNGEVNKIIELIKTVYEKLLEKMEELLKSLDITRIKVEKFEMYNYTTHKVFDVQETDNSDFHGRIYEVARYGYIYKDMIYTEEYRHIVRPAEVIVYKYMAQDH
ncbi:nucleotide exchange factor GrpE [Clostridium sp. BJN0013]|uniref:nucleotide exchange factor GrpE n=1 Tax=Clostridium sp. BJN0013 TaxID=3236840 RepID=UPI0034C6A73E